MKANNNKKYTGLDVYKTALAEIEQEMTALKGQPLNQAEEVKMRGLSRILVHEALKEITV